MWQKTNDASTGEKHHFSSKFFYCDKVGCMISKCHKKQADEEKARAAIEEVDSLFFEK